MSMQSTARFSFLRRTALSMACFVGLTGFKAPTPEPDACQQALSPEVLNACVVKADALWRGGKPTPAAAATLVQMGVRTVVNLEMLNSDMAAFQAARPDITDVRDVSYFRVREWEPNVVIVPSVLDRSVAEFIAITRTQAKPIYVHCRSGQNRTGVMVAAYRILENNEPLEAVLADMAKFNGVWFKQNAKYLRELYAQRADKIRALAAAKAASLQARARLSCSVNGCQKVAP